MKVYKRPYKKASKNLSQWFSSLLVEAAIEAVDKYNFKQALYLLRLLRSANAWKGGKAA